MFFILFFHLSKSYVIKFNNTNDLANKSINPLAIYCYRGSSKKVFKDAKKQIDLCSKFLPDIYFFIVNCSESNSTEICHKYCSSGNSYAMLRPGYYIYEGESIAFDLVNFFERISGKKRIDFQTTYEELNPQTYTNYLNSKSSSLIAFLEITDKISDLMIPQLQQLAFIYSGKPQIGVAYIDCKKYIDFCISQKVEYVPSLRAYHGNAHTDYTGSRTFDDLIEFANKELHEFRSNDGTLDKRAGIVPSLYPLVIRFMKDNDKNDIIEKVKKVEGSEYYVALMKRILRNGDYAIEKEEEKIRKALKKSQEKLATNDILRSSLNILKEFKKAGPYIPQIMTDREL